MRSITRLECGKALTAVQRGGVAGLRAIVGTLASAATDSSVHGFLVECFLIKAINRGSFWRVLNSGSPDANSAG